MKESEMNIGYLLPKEQRKAVESPTTPGEVHRLSSGKSVVIDSLQELEDCAAANPTVQNALDELYQFSSEQVSLMQGTPSPFIRLEDGKVIVVGLENSVEDTMERLKVVHAEEPDTPKRVFIMGDGMTGKGLATALSEISRHESYLVDGMSHMKDDLERMSRQFQPAPKQVQLNGNRAQRRADAKRQRRNRW